MNKALKTFFIIACTLAAITVLLVSVSNIIIFVESSQRILGADACDISADCIVVLGAGLKNDNTEPSAMLADRIITATGLYLAGTAPTVVMTGDRSPGYDEPGVMMSFAGQKGVPAENIILDTEGFSTYESIKNVSSEYSGAKIVIVTQKYHLYRAVYIARSLGMDAYGVAAGEGVNYKGLLIYELREIAARVKDFVICIFDGDNSYYGRSVEV